MAVKIARFNIDFTATSEQLRRVFKKVGEDAHSLADKVKSAFRDLSKNVFTGNLAADITKQVLDRGVQVIKDTFKSLDELGKMSERLGLDPADLKQFQIAAELGGAEIAQLETGLRQYLRQSYQAANGSKRLAAELDAVGVSLQDLTRMSIAQQIAAIGRGLNSLPNPAQRAAIAMDLFSESGVNLLQTLSPEALAKASEQMERMGSAITRDGVERIQEANDAWTLLKTTAQNLADTLAIQLAPAIKLVADEMNKAITGPWQHTYLEKTTADLLRVQREWAKAQRLIDELRIFTKPDKSKMEWDAIIKGYDDAIKEIETFANRSIGKVANKQQAGSMAPEPSVWDTAGLKSLFKEITYELPKRPRGIALAVSDLNLALDELHETLLLLAPGALWQGIQNVIGSVGPALRTIAERAGILPRAAAMALPAGTPAGGAFLAKGTSEAYSASRRSVDSQVANANIRTARNTQATVAAVKALGKLVGVKFRVVDAPHRGQ